MSGVSDVKTDQSKLQASFTYDDAKVKLDDVLDKLKSEWGGRYKASVAENK